MDWDDARYFLAIAREGQMLGAARRMRVSQARLSRRLAALEGALGTRLFDRSTRGSTLTDDGRAFLAVAERMEEAALAASSVLGREDAAPAGTVRIGAPDGLGSAFIAPRLGKLAEAFPRLHVQLVPMPRTFSLSEREADLAIMVGRPERGRLRAKKLCDYSIGLYAARSLLSESAPPDLAAQRVVGYVGDLLHTPELDYGSELLPERAPDIEISTAIGQVEAVRAGAGIGALHDFMAAGAVDLVPVMPERRVMRSYWAVWHENLAASRKVAAVVGFLEGEMRSGRDLFLPQRSQSRA